MTTMTLYRCADDDIIVGCASFAAARETAEAYRDNPGYGGRTLYQTAVEIDPATLLDLYDLDTADAISRLCEITGLSHPGAIGADEWAPRIWRELRNAGIEWVRVRDSYPADAETYIFVGEDDPELTEID